MTKRNHNRGYTMVLFLAFIAAVLLAGFSLYDNGTVATERIRMQNTADATAYSTVNVLTRDMNFIAYTNRAMVANQVAIGQMVGIGSWMHMIDTTAENLDTVAKITMVFPPVGFIITNITNALQTVTGIATKALDYALKIFILPAIEGAIGTLSAAQIAFQLATAEMAYATFTDVTAANDPDVTIGVMGAAATAKTMIESWKETVDLNDEATTKSGADNERRRTRFTEFAKVVTSSRDPFSTKRNDTWISADFPLPIYPLINFGMSVDKKGGSEFRQVTLSGKKLQWQWSAMDTVSLWFHLKWWGKSGCCWLKKKSSTSEVLPIGYGAAHAISKDKSGNIHNYTAGKSKQYWGNAWANTMSASLAAGLDYNNNLANKKKLFPYFPNGLRPFYDLKENDYRDTGPNLVVFLAKPRNTVKVQQSLDDNNASYNRNTLMTIEEQGSIAGGNLYGLSKAETYFSRPRDLWLRADNKREYGNLYNPYWQTRLIENNVAEQTAATAVQVVF